MTLYLKYGFAGKESDSSELKLLKRIIFIIALSCSFFGLVWAGMFYYLFGLVPVVILPILFAVIVLPAMIISHKLVNYKILVFAQLFCITWIGAFIQWNLGNIHEGGAVLVWTFLGPLGAMIFLSKKQAYIWFGMFIFILVVTVIYEPFLSENRLNIHPTATKVFYIMNIGVTFLIVFLSSLYFLYGIEHEKSIIKKLLKTTNVKNKEITDSIQYAQRLQKALLPTNQLISETFPNSFVLYMPKDIVSGDFYWLQNLENKILFAVGDCTGHGVPGALVSVICNGSLNRSVKDLKLTKPSSVLDASRKIVVELFEKSDEDVHDGMDIALCSISGTTLEYAGAHNPLWIVRDNKLIEIKANKQSIGKYAIYNPFSNHSFELQKNDTIYLFTDGYRDQFGSRQRKKLRIKGFRELILKVSKLPINQQEKALKDFINEWKEDLEQIDDICIMGVKI